MDKEAAITLCVLGFMLATVPGPWSLSLPSFFIIRRLKHKALSVVYMTPVFLFLTSVPPAWSSEVISSCVMLQMHMRLKMYN